jgi:hypothetical protein
MSGWSRDDMYMRCCKVAIHTDLAQLHTANYGLVIDLVT